MSYVNVLKQINEQKISPVYLLYGEESYFIQHFIEELKTKLLSHNEENLSTYDLEEIPVEDVIADVETYPFFGERKLIIAHNPVFLQTKRISLPFKHNVDSLMRYVQHPIDYSVLVIVAPYEQLDQRKKITKTLKRFVQVVECQSIKDYELESWIKHLASSLNVTIAPEAVDVFGANLTTNLKLLQNELIKCAQYVGKGGVITKRVAEDLLSHTPTSSSIQLVDAVIEKNLHKAIAIYKHLIKLNEEPISLIALLAFQCRMILQVKLLKQKGYNESQIRKKINAHPYVIKLAHKRERKFSVDSLKRMIDALTITDSQIKRGLMEKHLAFELLLFDLMKA